jgi:HAD superfamily hydrolase (TIGR01549 family)
VIIFLGINLKKKKQNKNKKTESKIITTDLMVGIFEEVKIIKKYGKTGKDLLDATKKANALTLNDGAFDAIKEIYNRGYKNIVLTNWFYETHVENLKKFDLLQFFTEIYSFDNFYSKPDPRVAQKVITENIDSYIIVGDSLKTDIQFANIAGIKSIWYNPNGVINTTEWKPTYEISSLKEILTILK